MQPQPLKTSPQYVVSIRHSPGVDTANLDLYNCTSVVCVSRETTTCCLDVIRRSQYYRHVITHLKYAGFNITGQSLPTLVKRDDYWFQVQCTDRGVHAVVCGCGPHMLWAREKRLQFDNLNLYESMVGIVELSYMI